MKMMLAGAAGVAALAAGSAPVLRAERAGTRTLAIRTALAIDVPPGQVARAQRTATEILQRAGVAVEWPDCQRPPGTRTEDACQGPLEGIAIALRIVNAPPGSTRDALGYAYVVTSGPIGRLATVFFDRVTALAARLNLGADVILGRAMAHEVGHLLLNSPTHSPFGLMRPRWIDAELGRDVAIDWVFSPAEAAEMRRRVALLH
jgi:hypothetical protein